MSTESKRRLPAGLYPCAECGAVRGETRELPDDWDPEEEGEMIMSTCLCDGLPCLSCETGRRRRPISNYYDPEDGQWWHVPSFMGHARNCRACRSR